MIGLVRQCNFPRLIVKIIHYECKEVAQQSTVLMIRKIRAQHAADEHHYLIGQIWPPRFAPVRFPFADLILSLCPLLIFYPRYDRI
jgi:hypothetical protein